VAPGSPTQFDVTRDAIITRCPGLERICPDAVDLAAAATAGLHDAINGRATALAGNRPPKHFREQLRGEDALTGEDIARLALQAPADVVAWVLPILKAIAHGAPNELAGVLIEVTPLLDERLQQTREQLAQIDAVIAPRVSAWKKAGKAGKP
jgi:hypothetical protein